MEVLQTITTKTGNELKNYLLRIGDLINVEGPLLSIFEDSRNGNLYLFDWVESGNNINRWLIYKASPTLINDFLLGDISVKQLFDSVDVNQFYFADIDNRLPIGDYNIKKLTEIPISYIPDREVYFDIETCKNFDKILAIVHRGLSLSRNDFSNANSGIIQQGSGNLNNVFSNKSQSEHGVFKAKNTMNWYKLAAMDFRDVKLKPANIQKHTRTLNFSLFYAGDFNRIPEKEKMVIRVR
jgi:hypothetical protein